jgi:GTP-binding protein HflX
VPVSALTGQGIEGLLERVEQVLRRRPIEVTLMVPFDRPEVVPWLHREAEVERVEVQSEGTMVRARVSERELPRVQDFLMHPVARRARR